MRLVLMVVPVERRGYSASEILDAVAQGEKPAIMRDGEDYVAQAQRWMPLVEAVAVYDDLPLTDDMRWTISLALSARMPVEYRRLPVDRISVIDRSAVQA